MATKRVKKPKPKPRKRAAKPRKKTTKKKTGKKNKGGRPKKEISKATLVRMASEGMPRWLCAKILGVSRETLSRRFKAEPDLEIAYENELFATKVDDWATIRRQFQLGRGYASAVYISNTFGVDDTIPTDAMETPADNNIIMALPDGRLVTIPIDSESSTSLSDAKIMACEPQETD
jgi:hypothetical protein